MRLDRLDLVRYGKFTDRHVDFGAAVPDRPDFHLVYGPNEAGKSTLFSAYLDLLFGIELKSAYGFLHPYATMRVGGLLTIGGKRREAWRVKRNQGSLVAADERPLPDTLFAPVLGGMDRAVYRTMFSLDDESIEKGGEDILRSEGELGAMLFSASSGLSDLASGLAGLKAEADEFYRPQARKHGLAALKAEIEALREARRDGDLSARDYGVLVRERDAAASRHEATSEARLALRATLAGLERSLDALPLLRRLRGLKADLGALDLGEAPPAHWRAMTAELAREEAEIETRAARIEAERERLAQEREALAEDDDVLAAAPEIAALAGSALEARFRTAAMDLATREAERDRLSAEVARQMAALGLSVEADPRVFLLPAGLGERLGTHFARRSGVVARAETAAREYAEAGKAFERTKAAPQEEAEEGDPAALSLLLRALRARDLPARLREAEREEVLARQVAEAAHARLRPWLGDPAALAGMAVPSPAQPKDLAARYEAAAAACRRIEEQALDAGREAAARAASLEVLLQTAGVVGEEEALALRAARDAAWSDHRARLDAESAAMFERSLRADDRAVEARLVHADRLSEMRLLERGVREAGARRAGLLGELSGAQAALAAVRAEIAALASGLGLPPESGPEAIGLFLQRRDEALAAAEAAGRAALERGLVAREAEEGTARLCESLGRPRRAGETLDEVLLAAEDRLAALREGQAARQSAQDAAERAERQLAERRAEADEAAAALVQWEEAWAQALAGTWLAGPGGPADAEAAGALLPALQALPRTIEQRDDYDHRVIAMRRDQEDYGARVGGIAARLGLPPSDAPAEAMAVIARRLDAAGKVRQRRQDIEAAFCRLDAEAADTGERRAVLDARLSEILGFLGCETLADADRLLEAHQRRAALLERIAEAGRDLSQRMRVDDPDEAEALLAAVDEAQLSAGRDEALGELERLDRDIEEQHAARARAEEALARAAAGDEAAVLDERRRTALVELAERSRRYLAARAGILAAEQALRLYRERHRSAMMERASRTFREITDGEYAGLSSIVEKESEFLVVNAASGGSKLARDLSKGTRFQLYLALRVAGYHEIAASREVVPFIADDIMETFDDTRALNALRVLASMAREGQVIYLTHHQHLCDLAREACPEVTIHTL